MRQYEEHIGLALGVLLAYLPEVTAEDPRLVRVLDSLRDAVKDFVDVSDTINREIEELSGMFQLTIPGKPQQKGSKTAFANTRKDGTPYASLCDTNKHAKPYQQLVRQMAAHAWEGGILTGPVAVHVTFEYQRPKAHYRSGKFIDLLKDDAPHWKTSKPDADKLIRTILDGLTGVVFIDDSQVVWLVIDKHYAGKNESRTHIKIQEL